MLKRYQISEGRFCDGTAETCPIHVYVKPDEAEKRYLVNELKLDEHTLASSLDPDELARLEFEPEHVAVIVKRPRSYSAEDLYLFRVSSMGLFLFRDKLVIVSGEDVQPLEGRQFQRISVQSQLETVDVIGLTHCLQAPRHAFGVAVLAPRADLGAARQRVPGALRPLDG